jgi:hypothetical protein
MSGQSDPYVLGGTQTEQQRLLAQATEFEKQSRWPWSKSISNPDGALWI